MLRRFLRGIIAALVILIVLLMITGIGMLRHVKGQVSANRINPFTQLDNGKPLPPDVQILRDVQFAKVGSKTLMLDILRPKSMPKHPIPAIVWIHGGWFHKGNRNVFYTPLFKLISHGFAVISIDYRLTQDAPFPAQVQDCKCAVRWLRAHSGEYGIDPRRIGACGGSAGGYLAAFLGTSSGVKSLEGSGGWQNQASDVQAVVDYYGPSDFREIPREIADNQISFVLVDLFANSSFSPISEFLGCSMASSPDKCRAASPMSYIGKKTPPFLILHGGNDATVPVEQSHLLYNALKKAKIEADLVIVKDGVHEFYDPKSDEKMIAFFSKHLAK